MTTDTAKKASSIVRPDGRREGFRGAGQQATEEFRKVKEHVELLKRLTRNQ
jgi:predicted heme/steroid binding protein